MKLPADIEAAVLATPGVVIRPVHDPVVRTRGGTPARHAPAPLAGPYLEVYRGVLTAMVPVRTSVEVNARAWKARSRRTDAAWRAVSRLFGPSLRRLAPYSEWYHAGGVLLVTFTRLGGRKADRSNLPTTVKGLEDALAYLMGCDDGDERWRASWEQEPGGPVGVRVRIQPDRKTPCPKS